MADAATIDQIGKADIAIGLVPSSHDSAEVSAAIDRILESSPPVNAVLIHPPYAPDGAKAQRTGSRWSLLPDPQLAQDRAALAQSLGASYRAIFDSALKLGVRACAVVASDLPSVTADWAPLLLEPATENGFDLIAPCYARHRFEGLINRAIVYPLVRALYGKQIRNPLGPDVGVSAGLMRRMTSGSKTRMHPLVSLVAEAITGGMKICQAHLGARGYPPPDWSNLSSLLAQVLGPLFLDVERYAPYWQRAPESQAVPEFGRHQHVEGPETAVDVTRLIETFQLGAHNLHEIWGMILPPSTLVELQRLARLDRAGFRMPDETWARVVYDFALAHRLRPISRDQLLKAITPIYLGWVASYALEVESASPDAVEQRLEKLCLTYESARSYLVSRWRWPDRFNP
ncbi:MAG TPA: hypothetical protein VKB79_30935 [Bryobacteraceae bacterium]|nr:hypothetical protein [Bryobacteraceae bacterium]